MNLMLSLVTQVLLAPAFTQPADVTLQTIRSEYAATLNQLTTVWTRARLQRSMQEVRLKDGESSGIPVEWAISGPKWFLSYGFDPNGTGQRGAWYSCDGDRVWTQYFFLKDQPEKVAALSYQSLTTATDETLRSTDCFGTFLGLYFPGTGKSQNGLSLEDLLARRDARLIGEELVDGVKCYRVECSNSNVDNSETYPVIAWFDPQHGFLPRQIRHPDERGKNSIDLDFVTLQFREVPNGSDGVVWFPEVCVHKNRFGKDILHLDDVRTGSLPETVIFTPGQPPGVPVFDFDVPENHDKLHSLTLFQTWMQRDDMKEKMALLLLEHSANPKARPAPLPVVSVIAEPPLPTVPKSKLSAGEAAFIVGGLFLLIGAMLSFRRDSHSGL